MLLRNIITRIGKVTARITMTMGARFCRKAIKVSSLTALPIMIFGGSPIKVAVPPMFEAMTSEKM
ncbi:hypothetical protein D3C76_1424200 [compost metagenome]